MLKKLQFRYIPFSSKEVVDHIGKKVYKNSILYTISSVSVYKETYVINLQDSDGNSSSCERRDTLNMLFENREIFGKNGLNVKMRPLNFTILDYGNRDEIYYTSRTPFHYLQITEKKDSKRCSFFIHDLFENKISKSEKDLSLKEVKEIANEEIKRIVYDLLEDRDKQIQLKYSISLKKEEILSAHGFLSFFSILTFGENKYTLHVHNRFSGKMFYIEDIETRQEAEEILKKEYGKILEDIYEEILKLIIIDEENNV